MVRRLVLVFLALLLVLNGATLLGCAAPAPAPALAEYPKTPEDVVMAYFTAVIEKRDSEAKKYLTPRFLNILEEAISETGSETFDELYTSLVEAETGIRGHIERIQVIGTRVWVQDEEVDVDYRLYLEGGSSVEFDMRLVKENSIWKIY